MARVVLSKKKADIFSNIVGLIALAILLLYGSFWPGILLVFWATLAARQFFTGRIWDLYLTSFLLLGLFVVYYFNIKWASFAAVLFCLGSIYIIFREYLYSDHTNKEEKSQEIKEDISDDAAGNE